MRATVLVLVAAACGGGSGAAPSPMDGPAADAAMDGPPPTDVDVTTYVRCCSATPLSPQAGVVVVAIDPQGNIIAGISDAAGHVTLANVQPNSTVYAGYAETDQKTAVLVTVFGVNPGVHLVFGDRFGRWDAHGTAGSMTVNVPAYAGASEYRVSSNCFSIPSGSTTITVPLVPECQTPTTDLYATAFDQGGAPVATSYSPNAPTTPNSVVATSAWVPSTSITVSLSGFTTVADYVDVSLGSVGTAGYDGTLGRVTPVNGSATVSMSAPRSGPALFAHVAPESLPPSGMGKHEYSAGIAIDATQVTIVDPGIPWVAHSLGDDTMLMISPMNGVYDAANVMTSFNRVDASSMPHTLQWSVIMPAGTTSFPWFPALPAELEPFALHSDDLQHGGFESTTLVDFSDAATYDAALSHPEWAFEVPTAAVSFGDVEGGVAIAHEPQ